MLSQDSHLTDHDLLLASDGELPIDRAAHLSKCWSCRARKQEIEDAIGDFVRFHRDSLDPMVPPGAGSRALLKAKLARIAATPAPWWYRVNQLFAMPHVARIKRATAAAVLAIAAIAVISYWPADITWRGSTTAVPVSLPEPSLTPGAVATADRGQVCAAPRPKNRIVPASLARRVFAEYGIPNARPQAYEVDYLITPALGGADDIRNLWPQSTADAVWNSRVKDALEDRLHDLVCDGDLDLVAAQRDLSSDWIAAYKKYFRTDQPLRTDP
jgi:hypothetical protein